MLLSELEKVSPLSDSSITNLLEKFGNVEEIITYLNDYDLQIPEILNGWMGIQSKMAVVLIHLSMNNYTITIPCLGKLKSLELYTKFKEYYKEICFMNQLAVQPNLKGLEGILKMRKRRQAIRSQ